jgi:Flp pilus assembly protein TadD
MPWAAGPNLQLAQTLEAAHEYEGAFKYAAEAVRQEPSNWQTWLVLARIESRRGNTAQARRYVLKSRSLNPGSTFWLRLGFQP